MAADYDVIYLLQEDLTAILKDDTLEDDVSRMLDNLPNMPTSEEQMPPAR